MYALLTLHNKYSPEISSNHFIPFIRLFSPYSAMHTLDACSNKRGTQFALLALIAFWSLQNKDFIHLLQVGCLHKDQ